MFSLCSKGNATNAPKSNESNMCDLFRINTNWDLIIGDGQSRPSINRKPINLFVGTCTFSDYSVVHVDYIAEINEHTPLDKVCIFSCGISIDWWHFHEILQSNSLPLFDELSTYQSLSLEMNLVLPFRYSFCL